MTPHLVDGFPRIDPSPGDVASVQAACETVRAVFEGLRQEIGRVIVGQRIVVDHVLVALLADGHVLLEGVPGLGKTLLVKTLGQTLGIHCNRIQFTPDLMPADITGTRVVVDDPAGDHREFVFNEGPVFCQLLLADEINRATPKSQAALLEAMQERSVTVDGHTMDLERLFLVMATQNPIEQEGTYPLPEAQLDRFLLKVRVPFAKRAEIDEILRRTTTSRATSVTPVADAVFILQAQQLLRHVIIAAHVQDYVVRLVLATHPGNPHGTERLGRLISMGASPRGAQAITTAAKVVAVIDGRHAVSFRDVEAVTASALRHRIVPSFEAEADGVTVESIVRDLLEAVPRHVPGEVV